MTITKVYEDEHIIVVVKPSGVNSEGGKGFNMPSLLAENGCEPLVVHRLDREVGGLMVLAKDKKTAANLTQQIQSGEFVKEYLTVVEGEVDENGELCDFLFHDRQKNKTYVTKRERKGVKKAVLSFKRLAVYSFSGTTVSSLHVKLHTGRTHQIRVQFASRKHPVLGDRKYGSSFNGEFALFSCRLSFNDVESGKRLDFKALPIGDWPGTLSADCYKDFIEGEEI